MNITNIKGLQKTTLLDFPGRVACTVFFGGCNFRCPFCHNAQLVLRSGEAQTVSTDELLSFLRRRSGILDGVCLTGGEPLLTTGLDELIRAVRSLGFAVKLDTNGSFPERLEALLKAELLDYVAMDVKASRERYPAAVGIPNFDPSPIERSVELLKNGSIPFEFRTTAVKPLHDADDFRRIAEWLAGDEPYFIQGYADSGDLIDGGSLSAFSRTEHEKLLSVCRDLLPNAALRGV